MKRYAIILASGVGSRAGGDVPKQFRTLAGRPMVYWSMKAFFEAGVAGMVVVIHPDFLSEWETRLRILSDGCDVPLLFVAGGASRIESVKCGLEALSGCDKDVLVAVHDAARPMVTPRIIEAGFDTAARGFVAVPAVPVSDSLRRIESSENTKDSEKSAGIPIEDSIPVDRSHYRAVQTPQIAPLEWLTKGYALPMKPHFTDDSSILQDAGYPVALYPGACSNIKVTNPEDFAIARELISL